jgi:hypothetical protein
MKIFLLFASFVLILKSFSQSKYSVHATQVQLGFGGPGIFSSLNIDFRFAKKEKGLGFHVGIGITPLGFLKDRCNRGSLNGFPIWNKLSAWKK